MIKAPSTNEAFPATRLRRPRAEAWPRRMVRETTLRPDNLIWPLFVREGDGTPEPVFFASHERNPERGADRVSPPDAACRDDPAIECRDLFLVAAGAESHEQDRPDCP